MVCQLISSAFIERTRLYGRAVTSVTVTPAAHRDMDSFVASVIGLFREDAGEHDPSMDIDWPVRDGRAYYSGLLSEESCLLAVARDGDLVVGHLVGKLLAPDSLRLHRFAVLESMRVDPSLRGRGIGSMLIKYFLHWAGERGAQQASVTAFAANKRAQRLYRRHGFAPSAVTMRRGRSARLPTPRWRLTPAPCLAPRVARQRLAPAWRCPKRTVSRVGLPARCGGSC